MWEPYTRRFLIYHDCDAKQYRDGFEVLRECRGHAFEILRQRKVEINETDEFTIETRKQLRATSDSRTQETLSQQLGRAEKRKTLLLAPVERIFEDCLKAKLKVLLTPQQRELSERNNQ